MSISYHIDFFKSESLPSEEKLKNKFNLLKSPIDILTQVELDDINSLFEKYSESFVKLSKHFEDDQEHRKTDLEKYKEIKKKYQNYKSEVEFYNRKFLEGNYKKMSKHTQALFSELDNASVSSEGLDADRPKITQVFLNTIINTKHIESLTKKRNLLEERLYLSKIFLLKLNDSKDQILVDFYMNLYKFCINNHFSIEKISTFFSIMYFIMNYSIMNKKIIKRNSFELFIDLIDFHSLHRPPYSYEIFDPKEKSIIIDFIQNTFYRNYILFENIFKYNVNIFLSTKFPVKIPGVAVPKVDQLRISDQIEEIENFKFYDFVKKNLIDRNDSNIPIKKKSKSEMEKYQDRINEKMNNFKNSFYMQAKTIPIDADLRESNELIDEANLMEMQEAKHIMEMRTKEIVDETQEKIGIFNKAVDRKVFSIPNPNEKKKT